MRRAFFARTAPTAGLTSLLERTGARLRGVGGDPITILRTAFGAGKTHNLLALYHLGSGTAFPGVPKTGRICRAAVVGTALSPGQPTQKSDGTTIHTLWGELAWQLGGPSAYKTIESADKNGTSPGSAALGRLLDRSGPSLVLIDEWVAYARQLEGAGSLPAGTMEAQLSFAQSLTEAVRRAPQAALVVTLPGRPVEAGGPAGRRALEALSAILGRIGAPWTPPSALEKAAIIRTRLFAPIDTQARQARNRFAQALLAMTDRDERFPASCREPAQLDRITAAWPLHPSLLDALLEGWSTLEGFQGLRGALRISARIVEALWRAGDESLWIGPGTVPLDDPQTRAEILRCLDPAWGPILYGAMELADRLDAERFDEPCRQMACAMFMATAPRGVADGLDARAARLWTATPESSIDALDDGLTRLTSQARHLLHDGVRWWFSTHPSLNLLVEEQAARIAPSTILDVMRKGLEARCKPRGGFAKVLVWPKSVPDARHLQLVVLGPDCAHAHRDGESPALERAQNLIDRAETTPRRHRNALLFLAPDASRLDTLRQAIAQREALRAIETTSQTLEPFQHLQIQPRLKEAEQRVEALMARAWSFVMAPHRPDPRGAVAWDVHRTQAAEHLPEAAWNRLVAEGAVLESLGAQSLALELERVLWDDEGQITRDALTEAFSTRVFLPRLADPSLIDNALEAGGQGPEAAWTLRGGQVEKLKPKDTAQPVATAASGTQFSGTLAMPSRTIKRQIRDVSDEILALISEIDGASAALSLKISLELPADADPALVRAIVENCKTLGFESNL